MATGLYRSYNDCVEEENKSYQNAATIAQSAFFAHTVKIIAKILRGRIEKKIEDVLGEEQFGFRRGKGTRNAI